MSTSSSIVICVLPKNYEADGSTDTKIVISRQDNNIHVKTIDMETGVRTEIVLVNFSLVDYLDILFRGLAADDQPNESISVAIPGFPIVSYNIDSLTIRNVRRVIKNMAHIASDSWFSNIPAGLDDDNDSDTSSTSSDPSESSSSSDSSSDSSSESSSDSATSASSDHIPIRTRPTDCCSFHIHNGRYY